MRFKNNKLIYAKISFDQQVKERQLEIPVLLMLFQTFNETFKFNINMLFSVNLNYIVKKGDLNSMITK